MKIKLTRWLLAAMLTLALGEGMLFARTLASGTTMDVKEKNEGSGTLTVTVYQQGPGSSGTGAPITNGMSAPMAGVSINALRIGSIAEVTTTDPSGAVSTQVAFGLDEAHCPLLGLAPANAIAQKDNTYYYAPTVVQNALSVQPSTTIETYLANNMPIQRTTQDNGVASFENLVPGLYLLAKYALPANAITDLTPFLVSVPMYVENQWKNDVYAYPKIRTDDITVSKTVAEQGNSSSDSYIHTGQTLKYTVTATIPAATTDFSRFVVTDANADGTLNIDQSTVKVQLGSQPLEHTPKYEAGKLTITLTENGLAMLNDSLSQAQTLTVTYDATAATNGAFSNELTNTAKVTYQRSEVTTTTALATVRLYTFGIRLTKTLSDNPATGISADAIAFQLYRTNTSGTLSDPVCVKDDRSGYWVTAISTPPTTGSSDDAADADTMFVGSNGNLSLYVLEPGTYYLKETATMSDYTLLAEPITIVILADSNGSTATVNGVSTEIVDGIVSLSVENTKISAGFLLPQTGGTGTLLATAIGLGLLCAAVILLVIYRKKS